MRIPAIAASLIIWLGCQPLQADQPDRGPMPREVSTRYDVPYKLTDSMHVMVRVKLNGKGPFNFILDTGAPALIMTEATAKKANAELDKQGWGEFKLELEGGVVVPQSKGLAMDMFQLKGMNAMGIAGVELHGVIGYNVLARYRIQYDFTEDKLVWTPLKFEPPKMVGLGQKGGEGGMGAIGDMMKFLAPLMGMKPNFELKPRGFLGVELEEKNKEVFVKSVLADGPAAKAGIKPGDRIATAKNNDVVSIEDVQKAAAGLLEGQKLKLEIRRGTEKKEINLELGRGL